MNKPNQRCYGRRCVAITSPDRILFPKDKITKLELIDYYEKIAPTMLLYMKNRILTMQRFPEGIAGESFYQKDIPEYFPAWIKRVPVARSDGGIVHYMVCENVAGLVYLANAACITPHLFLSKIDKLHYPDQMIFDLDPSKKNDFATVKKVAWIIKDVLEALGLVPFVKTTGSRGVHVQVPLTRKQTYDEVKKFARSIAELIVGHYPALTTLEMRKAKRGGKIFIDYLRNAFTATAVAPYAVRAREGAPIAMPITWEDLKKPSLNPQSYTIKNVFKSLDEQGDAWKDMQRSARSLTKAMELLQAHIGKKI